MISAKFGPKPIITNPREWIMANMSKGNFDHGEATFKGMLKWDNLDGIAITDGKGVVLATNGTVTYMDGMPPVEGVNAEGEFDLNQMTIKVSGRRHR